MGARSSRRSIIDEKHLTTTVPGIPYGVSIIRDRNLFEYVANVSSGGMQPNLRHLIRIVLSGETLNISFPFLIDSMETIGPMTSTHSHHTFKVQFGQIAILFLLSFGAVKPNLSH